jgi:hypothetical protein
MEYGPLRLPLCRQRDRAISAPNPPILFDCWDRGRDLLDRHSWLQRLDISRDRTTLASTQPSDTFICKIFWNATTCQFSPLGRVRNESSDLRTGCRLELHAGFLPITELLASNLIRHWQPARHRRPSRLKTDPVKRPPDPNRVARRVDPARRIISTRRTVGAMPLVRRPWECRR